MKTATVAELHEKLDELLDVVRSGEAVQITDEKGRMARLVPDSPGPSPEKIEALIAAGFLRRGGGPTEDLARRLPPPEVTGPARIEALIAAGVLYRPGSGKLRDDFFSLPLAKFSSGSVVDDLLEEREEGW